MAFATAAELASYLQVPDVDTATANLLLDQATAVIQAETGQTFTLVNDDEVTLLGSRTYSLNLPQRPVVDVTAVEIDGTALDTEGFALRGNVLYRTSGWWDGINTWDAALGTFPAQITVTYSHGYATIPDDVKGVCLAAAARGYTNPSSLASETTGGYSESFSRDSSSTGVSLTEDERRLLRRRYGRTAFSLSVA